ncbi:MAG: AraC family transcriptional regulator [Pseudomonadales bacterium]|nr:AraC family transcriptional regulator [Pseudomonadales bacterium]
MHSEIANSTIPSDSDFSQATLLASWVQVLYRTAELRGLEPNELLQSAGINVKQLYNGESRVLAHKMKVAWELAAQQVGDSAFGLSAAQVAFPTMFHSLGVAMNASHSLAEAFKKFIRLRQVVDTLAVNSVEESGQYYKFSWTPVSGVESVIGGEAFGACLLTLCRWSCGIGFAPLKVTLIREMDLTKRYPAFFRAPVEFGCHENALYFDRNDIHRPLPTANSQLAAKSEALTQNYLVRTIRDDVVNKAHAVLLRLLPGKNFSIDRVAEELYMSTRTLQRKLSESGVSYDSLLDGIRRERALECISDRHLSLQEISHILGFSDSSNFGRAFKRWSGVSPGDYRKQ